MNTECSSRAIHLLADSSRTLLAVGLLALALVFSPFSFAPSAHAASVQRQTVVPLCTFTRIAHTPGSVFDVNLWRDSCNGDIHAQLLAHQSHTYQLSLWGNATCSGSPLQTVRGQRSAGQSLNTREFHISSACAIGEIV